MNLKPYKDLGISRIGRTYFSFNEEHKIPNILIIINSGNLKDNIEKYHVIEELKESINNYYFFNKEQILEKFNINIDNDCGDQLIIDYLKSYKYGKNLDIISCSVEKYSKVIYLNKEDLINILLKVTNQPVDEEHIEKEINFVNLMSHKYGLITLRKNI